MQFFLLHDFFALDPFLSHDFCLEFMTKNTACVNGTIEITLERFQRDIAANSRRQNCSEFALCVSRHLVQYDFFAIFAANSCRWQCVTSIKLIFIVEKLPPNPL